MDMISSLGELLTAIGDEKKNINSTTHVNLFGKKGSLTEALVKQTIHVPVLITDSILQSDEERELAIRITRLIENNVAALIQSSALINYKLDANQSVLDYITTSSEESVFLHLEETYKDQKDYYFVQKDDGSLACYERVDANDRYVADIKYQQEYYCNKDIGNYDNATERLLELTASLAQPKTYDEIKREVLGEKKETSMFNTESDKEADKDDDDDDDKSNYDNRKFDKKDFKREEAKRKETEEYFGKIYPTKVIIVVQQQLDKSHTKDIRITLFVKGNHHILGTSDMQTIFRRYTRDANVFQSLIRWNTGEIKFFRDVLFAWDDMMADLNYRETQGKHSWFRIFENNKGKKALGDIALAKQVIKMLNLGKFFLNESKVPLCTIVTTFDELEAGLNVPIKKLKADSKYIRKIITDLYLLGIIVVDRDPTDPTNNIYLVYFDGFDEPYTYHGKTLPSVANKPSEQVSQAKKILR